MTTTLTYSDIHTQRIKFFHSLFEKFHLRWHESGASQSQKLESSAVYHVSIGTFEARNQKDLEDYLCFTGSRIVFLIDWNRARKSLRNFLKKKDCVNVLKWSAENNLGHRAYLKMGGEQLIFGCLEKTMKSPLKFGDRFEQVLGPALATEFLQFVLRTCTEGLMQNRSEFLIRDEVLAELGKYLKTTDENLLQIAANHAALIVEVSTTVRDGLVQNIDSFNHTANSNSSVRITPWESPFVYNRSSAELDWILITGISLCKNL
jgi:hypothetical protein